MPLPQVTCGSDYLLAYDASPRVISLSASATEGPDSYEWRVLGKPLGSVVDSGVHGDFVNGVSTLQNPTVEIDGAIDGGYTFQCVAHNHVGWSDPDADKENGQQVVRVKTMDREYILPAFNQFKFAEDLVATLRLIEADIVTLRGGPQAFYSPENVPRLVWSSNSVLQLDHWESRPDLLRLKLSDGLWYTAPTPPLSIDFSITGRGGREASTSDPEVASAFYHIYAIPSTTPNEFVCIASVTAPPTGIVDFAAWKYLGTVYNNASSNIRRFIHRSRDEFSYIDPTEEALEIYCGFAVSPTLNSWADTGSAQNIGAVISGQQKLRALKYALPDELAHSVNLSVTVGASTGYLFIDGGIASDVIWTPPTTASYPVGWGAVAAAETTITAVEREIMIRGQQIKFYWRSGSTLNWSVIVKGYRDKYLIAGEV